LDEHGPMVGNIMTRVQARLHLTENI